MNLGSKKGEKSTVTTILEKIVDSKRREIARAKARTDLATLQRWANDAAPPRNFASAIAAAPGIALIAEVKKASPSQGILRADFDPVGIACAYADAGATCLSVLTDEPFFQGHLHYLRLIRAAVDLPLLRKDFILDEYQIVEARVAGADAILLIAECLAADQLTELHDCARAWGMTALVEFHREEMLDKVLGVEPRLVGVNNRDLATFAIDLGHSLRLRSKVPQDILLVSESGIASPDDVALLERHGINAMLVGESLVSQPDIAAATRRLLSGRTKSRDGELG